MRTVSFWMIVEILWITESRSSKWVRWRFKGSIALVHAAQDRLTPIFIYAKASISRKLLPNARFIKACYFYSREHSIERYVSTKAYFKKTFLLLVSLELERQRTSLPSYPGTTVEHELLPISDHRLLLHRWSCYRKLRLLIDKNATPRSSYELRNDNEVLAKGIHLNEINIRGESRLAPSIRTSEFVIVVLGQRITKVYRRRVFPS